MGTTPLTPGLPFHPGAGLNQAPSGGATIGDQLKAKMQPLPVVAQPEQPPSRPNILSITADPKFQALSGGAQIEVLSRVDPNFAALSGEAQQEVLTRLKPAAPAKTYLPGREFGMEVAKGMGLDAEKIKAAEDKGGQGEALKEIGRQVFEGLSGFAGSVLKDPFNVMQPVHGMASGIEGAIQQKSPGQLVGALSTVLGGAETAEKVVGAPGKIANALPSAERAGATFEKLSQTIGTHPVAITDDLSKSLNELRKSTATTNTNIPAVVRKLVDRLDPFQGGPPLTYDEARSFSSEINRLSASDKMSMTPNAKRLVGDLNQTLKATVQDTAELAGKGKELSGAMREYHRAMQVSDMTDAAKAQAWKWALVGIGGAGAYEIAKLLGLNLSENK